MYKRQELLNLLKQTESEKEKAKAICEQKRVNKEEDKKAFEEKMGIRDRLWAANGINRQESGKRTAPSAMNRHQDGSRYSGRES